MRFVWKLIQRDAGGPPDHEKMAMQAVAESKEASQEVAKHRDHLKAYFERTDKMPKSEKEKFNSQLVEWYNRGDKVSMRMGGVSEAENDKDYLKRHARLSSAFVSWDKKGERIAGSVNFKGNETGEHKVGLGDILPPIVKVVKVRKKNGEVVDCVRTQNPRTGRIGYYETGNLAKGKYLYVAIHSGDQFEVTRTVDPKDPKAQRDILREHVLVYRGDAMKADEGEELYYDDRGQPLTGTPAAKKASQKRMIYGKASQQRAGFQKALGSLGAKPQSKPRSGPKKAKLRYAPKSSGSPRRSPSAAPRLALTAGTIEVGGKRYQRLTRNFLETHVGKTEAQTSRWLVDTNFLGQAIKVNPMVLPYLKEAESRIRAAGIDFKLKPSAGGCQCYNHRGIRKLDGSTGKTLSKHSFGIAFDINPGDHPFGTSWAKNNNPDKMPVEMVKIMQDCGFIWGDRFKNRDPMHFELGVNPFTSQDIIKSDAGKQALSTMESFAGKLGDNTREAWAKAPKGTPTQRAELAEGIRISKTTNAHQIVDDYNYNSQKMKLDLNNRQATMVESFFKTFEAHKADYEGVSQATGLPPILIAIIHFRESSMRFDRYLHNGQKLGQTTTAVPAGILFQPGQWKEAAIHALGGNIRDANGKPSLKAFRSLRDRLGLNSNTTDMGKIMAFCEFYNGLGYRKKGRTSPYAVAGTNLDMGGMYVADGKFNPNKKDPRIGAGAILLAYNDRAGSPVMKPGEAFA